MAERLPNTMVPIVTATGVSWEEKTLHLKFIGGKLHQLFFIYGAPNHRQEWRPVPSEEIQPNDHTR